MMEKLPIGKIITAVDEARSRKVVHIRYEMITKVEIEKNYQSVRGLVIFLLIESLQNHEICVKIKDIVADR